MIKGYKQIEVIDTPSENCSIIKVTKDGKTYLMHQFDSVDDADQYTFRIRKKLNKCLHLVKLVEEFEDGENKYYVSEYIQMDLLKLTHSKPGHVQQLNQALSLFVKLIEILQELHRCKLVYRNVRPQKIRVKGNQLYLFDFSLSQFVKRKERMFEIVGVGAFLAPQYFSEDGYGVEVDVWASGVLLFYLLVHQYPFKFKGNDQAAFKEQFLRQCGEGFRFNKSIEGTNFDGPPLKGNKNLEDFFRRIFHPNPVKRITISQMKQHPLLEGYFPNETDPEMLAVIQESGKESSIFLSKMYKFPCSKILHKEQVILDFIQETAELFLLECHEIYPEQLRYRTQFAVLKVGLTKCRILLDITYGKREPFFKIDPLEWQAVRGSSALNDVKDKLERKYKILHMIYKNAYLNVKHNAEKEPFFNEALPQHFEEVKIAYRGTLSEMFELGRKSLSKAKGNRRLSRKLTESLVRVIILFLVNRLFESQEQIQSDFPQYLAWSKTRTLEDLQDWIETEQLANLKLFMKSVTSKYL